MATPPIPTPPHNIWVNGSRPTIIDTSILDAGYGSGTGDGVYAAGGSAPLVRDCTFEDVTGTGISLDHAPVFLENNTVTGNGDYGIQVSGGSASSFLTAAFSDETGEKTFQYQAGGGSNFTHVPIPKEADIASAAISLQGIPTPVTESLEDEGTQWVLGGTTCRFRVYVRNPGEVERLEMSLRGNKANTVRFYFWVDDDGVPGEVITRTDTVSLDTAVEEGENKNWVGADFEGGLVKGPGYYWIGFEKINDVMEHTKLRAADDGDPGTYMDHPTWTHDCLYRLYISEYPTLVSLNVGDDASVEWTHPGPLAGMEQAAGLAQAFQDYVDANEPDASGNVLVPVAIISQTWGSLRAFGLGVEWTADPVIKENVVRSSGGGITVEGVTSVIRGNVVEDNAGTGIKCFNSSATVQDNPSICNNSYGISIEESTDCAITNNTVMWNYDGGIYLLDGTGTIEGNTLRDNVVAIDVENSTATVSGNDLSYHEAGVRTRGGIVTVQNCTLRNNRVGMQFADGTADALDNTVIGSEIGVHCDNVTGGRISGNWIDGNGVTGGGGESGSSIELDSFTFDPEISVPRFQGMEEYDQGLYLIQLDASMTEAMRSDIADSGAVLYDYVPNDAYLMEADQAAIDALATSPGVRWAGRYYPIYRIERSINPAIEPYTITTRNVTVFVAGDSQDTVSAVRDMSLGVIHEGRFKDYRYLDISVESNDIPNIAELRDVCWIEPLGEVRTADELSAEIVGGNWTQAAPWTPWDGPGSYVNSLGYDGSGVTIAVADTGIDDTHQDLKDRIAAVYVYGPMTDDDTSGHGTHCAGIAAGNASIGTLDTHGYLYGWGVAPNASLVSQKIGTGPYLYYIYPDQLIQDALNSSAYVSSNSWGSDGIRGGEQRHLREHDDRQPRQRQERDHRRRIRELQVGRGRVGGGQPIRRCLLQQQGADAGRTDKAGHSRPRHLDRLCAGGGDFDGAGDRRRLYLRLRHVDGRAPRFRRGRTLHPILQRRAWDTPHPRTRQGRPHQYCGDNGEPVHHLRQGLGQDGPRQSAGPGDDPPVLRRPDRGGQRDRRVQHNSG